MPHSTRSYWKEKSMGATDIIIRSMNEEDIPKVIEMRSRQNEFLNTPAQFIAWFKTQPSKFKVALTTEGKLIGTCCAVMEHEKLYHIGMYSVHERYQGRGIGMRLWNAVWESIGKNGVVLTARRPMIPKYSRFFLVVEEKFTRESYGTDKQVNRTLLNSNCPEGIQIELFNELHLSTICTYDLQLFGYKRSTAMKLNCMEKTSRTFVALRDGTCVGFGTVRIGLRGHAVVGPLYCDNSQVAEALLKSLILSSPLTKGLIITVPNMNTYAIKLLKKLGCEKVDEAVVMYTDEQARKRISNINLDNIFGIFCVNFAVL